MVAELIAQVQRHQEAVPGAVDAAGGRWAGPGRLLPVGLGGPEAPFRADRAVEGKYSQRAPPDLVVRLSVESHYLAGDEGGLAVGLVRRDESHRLEGVSNVLREEKERR